MRWIEALRRAGCTGLLPVLYVAASASGQVPQQAAGFVVVVDAAHGGSETGAQLSPSLPEKELVLALSIHLRSTLKAHGIAVITTREDDSNPAPDSRAAAANRSHAAACLLLHATTSGTGVHLYTSSLTPAAVQVGALKPWATAQATYITQSLKLSSDIREALSHAGVAVTLGSVSVAPIDSMACPAVLIEAAPLLARRGQSALALGDAGYQGRLVEALTAALEEWRADWKGQP